MPKTVSAAWEKNIKSEIFLVFDARKNMINRFISLYVLKNIFLNHKKEKPTHLELGEGSLDLPYSWLDIQLFVLTLGLFHFKTFLLALILYDLHTIDNGSFLLKYKERKFECPRNIYFSVVTIVYSLFSFSIRDPLLLLSVFLLPDFELLLKMIKK